MCEPNLKWNTRVRWWVGQTDNFMAQQKIRRAFRGNIWHLPYSRVWKFTMMNRYWRPSAVRACQWHPMMKNKLIPKYTTWNSKYPQWMCRNKPLPLKWRVCRKIKHCLFMRWSLKYDWGMANSIRFCPVD